MNDAVLIDLQKQLDREEEWDEFRSRVEAKAENIRESYLSDPHQFAEITELLYHNDLHWPIEECMIEMIRNRRLNPPQFKDAAIQLTTLFEEQLNRYCDNLAFTQIKMKELD
jgi:hypothetical protein